MSLAVLIPYRPDSPQRERIAMATADMWAEVGVEVVHCDDGRSGLFSLTRAVNRARARTDADALLIYSVDALPPPVGALADVEREMSGGVPWVALFDGQQRYTPEQTDAILAGGPAGQPDGEVCMGREAIVAVRADVWDDLRGMDERFIGWGQEDAAWHRVLATVHPDGDDSPAHGLFRSLWHPSTTRAAFTANARLYGEYLRYDQGAAMREWYLSREVTS